MKWRVEFRSRRLVFMTALAAVIPLGCSTAARTSAGADGGTADGAAPPTTRPPPTALPEPGACTTNRPGPRTLRRLTAQQYAESLRDLFHDPAVPVAKIFNDPLVLGFSDDAAALVVRDLTSQQMMSYAETVADWAVEKHLFTLINCPAMDAACAHQFIRSFGKRVFRAPLTEKQAQRYDVLFAGEPFFAAGIQVVIAAMLQSPNFVYRRELGAADPADPTSFVLTPHEVASALSYLLVGTTPDDALLAAADDGSLTTAAGLDAEVQRLRDDPRSRDAVLRFFTGWLGLGRVITAVKDDQVFQMSDSLRQAMVQETTSLIVDNVFARNGTLADLLTAPYSFLTPELAQHYGLGARVAAGATGATLVAYAAADRDPGILAHGSVLAGYAAASTSSPVQRGKLVRTRLLCQSLPPPPADVNTKLPPLGPTETTRQRSEQHIKLPVCSACHSLIDQIGYGFEHYDGFGRRREQENGQPINAAGVLEDVREGTVRFDGLAQLGRHLADSEDVKDCLIRYWSYYAYGRAAWEQDACTYDAIRKDAAANGFTVQSVLTAIIHAPHFTRRVADP